MNRLGLNLRLPVIAAPMFLVSGPALVIAACRAGIVGSFPTTNCRTAAEVDAWMGEITAAIDGAPWAANLITHSTNTRRADDLALVAKYRPPLVITALGSPAPVIETVHAYGGTVLADVIDPTLARKALAAGADGLACVATGAGGHTGKYSPLAFVSAVRAFFDGPLALGGGIADGAGVAAAVAAGADLIYMGTRFVGATESLAVPAYKAMVAEAGIDDIVVSGAVTGTPASWLRASFDAAGYTVDGGAPERNYDSAADGRARWRDIWSAGQGVHATTGEQTTAAIVDDLDRGFSAAQVRLASWCGRTGHS
ncbi:2-nitropropane dioxygenase [Sphingomonas sp. Leaf357]|uniref:NAD(P)H-dependent flavin oxidoreductase n=1 Tax=Sphingomonas sp. Leaf357 TaxID=1736350 RepID=UPI0006F8BB60|nr:nitronate monooxygenase [Sphingomonas sp. Leaf357]KQS03874.1 2-nitropropane dioxygenase [Sphingomonas sp. Leaf357]